MPKRGKSMRKRTETVPKRRKKRGPVWDPARGRDGQETCSNWLLYSSA